jgi:hypothetical protein
LGNGERRKKASAREEERSGTLGPSTQLKKQSPSEGDCFFGGLFGHFAGLSIASAIENPDRIGFQLDNATPSARNFVQTHILRGIDSTAQPTQHFKDVAFPFKTS